MNKITKIWLIVGAALVALGLVIFAGVMTAYDYDFTKLSTVTYEAKTHEIGDAFDKIAIDVNTTEIKLAPSADEMCRIECFETDKVKYSASVQDSTLIIEKVDTRKWYDYIGIFLGKQTMTVYLPQDNYASLSINTNTGDVKIPKDFTFGEIEIDGDTADVQCLASISKNIEIELSTGSINMAELTAENIDFSTATGDININNVNVNGNVETETDTGNISLNNVVAKGDFEIESSTGNVKFEKSDAAQIFVKTSTGNVTGNLLSEKIFITETSTGNVSVPKTASGGKCKITTSTGNIEIHTAP